MPETKEVIESLRNTKFASKHAKLIGDAIAELEALHGRCNELNDQLHENALCRSTHERTKADLFAAENQLLNLQRKQKSLPYIRGEFFAFGIVTGILVAVAIDFLFSTR